MVDKIPDEKIQNNFLYILDDKIEKKFSNYR
jgi:hypothetical protein